MNAVLAKYLKKPSPRPVVGLPMPSRFLECVAIDLKFYRKHILLHMIDHATRLSASTVITSKKPDIIISKIFQVWICVYGLPEKFLSDNGGEFANEHSNTCFLTRDSVYFKRAHKKRCRGPGKVLGQDGQQVLIKYGAIYVRVHPCQITLARNPIATTKPPSKDNTETDNDRLKQTPTQIQIQIILIPPIQTPWIAKYNHTTAQII